MLHKLLRSILRLRSQPPPSGIAFAWYEAAQWPLLRQVSLDRDRLEKTHDEWLKVAQARYDELIRQDKPVEKVIIDVDDMFRWCREMGHKGVTAEGRSLYAVYRLKANKEKRRPLPIDPAAQ